MADRRDAATALELTPKLEGFIQDGLPNEQPPANEQPGKLPPLKQPKARSTTPKRHANVAARRKERRPAEVRQDSPEFARTLSRARIQKSIRFLPQLIAQFEEHARKEESAGRRPPSVQDAMNEALELWLREARPTKKK